MAVVAFFIDNGHGLTVEVHHINQPNKSKILLYGCHFHFNIPFKYTVAVYEDQKKCFSY